MKKIALVAAAIMVALAVLLPFVSTTPDGLETLAENSGHQEQPYWNGIMAGYSVAITNPYFSTLIAGLFGTAIVLIASFAVSSTLASKKKPRVVKEV
jgi:hypothetical protein